MQDVHNGYGIHDDDDEPMEEGTKFILNPTLYPITQTRSMPFQSFTNEVVNSL